MVEPKHFSEEEIALCAKAIAKGTFKQMDVYFTKHISECDDCANKVTKVSSILEAEAVLVSELSVKQNDTN